MEAVFKRRDFLKVLGAGAGLAVSGCSKELPEKIIPYVIQPDEVIPGVANWYAGTCAECSTGCGVLVRVREGRAVKLEGNPQHPVNKGGLCAIGQSALQAHYNPDRIREPQARINNKGPFVPTTWEKAVAQVADGLKQLPDDKKVVLLTGGISGSLKDLIAEFADKYSKLEHIQYELFDRSNFDVATEKAFGVGKRAELDFSKADVVVSVGADFLETWLSPVEYARQWAEKRKPDADGGISFFVHVEPRLSLTASNADRWIANTPGSESQVLLALLKAVFDKVGSENISGSSADVVREITAKTSIESLLKGSGVSREQLDGLAGALSGSKTSLVVAGGAASQGDDGLSPIVLAHLLNATLGNIGKSVRVYDSGESTPAKTSYLAMRELLEELKKDNHSVGAIILSGVNPVYLMPKASGIQKAFGSVPYVFAISTTMDESSAAAQVVLPLSTNLESWTDSNSQQGVWNLNQPAMSPLYPSQGLGDTLIALAAKLDVPLGADVSSFYDYMRASWQKRTGGADFESRWQDYVQKGGSWANRNLDSVSVSIQSTAATFAGNGSVKGSADSLFLLAYPSINSIDGKAANRPWMQELPNPMTSAIWDSWAEIHPDTASKIGVNAGDIISIGTENGSVEVSAYLNHYLHENLIAIPIGQGHEAYCRYADGVGANVLGILSYGETTQTLLVSGAKAKRSISSGTLVTTQGSVHQKGRGIAQAIGLSQFVDLNKNHGHHGKGLEDAHVSGNDSAKGKSHHGGGHGSHDFGPQPERPQMYKQMQHPEYRWGMTVDLASCTGCAACVVACYAENNIAVVGKELSRQGREMSWLRIERYVDGPKDQPVTGFVPMMCQQCGHAPCEPVCPVYATYHNEQGLNAMVYNRCVGTRYCANNCSYKVRRFNWFHYTYAEPLNWQLNPDVTVREVGVMEKCSFCVQRIKEATNIAKDEGRGVRDGDIQPACASSCPTKAITFGNLKDEKASVSVLANSARSYKVLDHHLNTQPAVTYLARVKNDRVGDKEV